MTNTLRPFLRVVDGAADAELMLSVVAAIATAATPTIAVLHFGCVERIIRFPFTNYDLARDLANKKRFFGPPFALRSARCAVTVLAAAGTAEEVSSVRQQDAHEEQPTGDDAGGVFGEACEQQRVLQAAKHDYGEDDSEQRPLATEDRHTAQ